MKTKNMNLTSVIKDHDFIDDNKMILAKSTGYYILKKNNFFQDKNEFLYVDYVRSYSCIRDSINKKNNIGTIKGLYQINDNYDKIELKFKGKSVYIKDMVQSYNGEIWCLSFKNGLYKIVNDKITNNITTLEGLSTNVNSFIKYDCKNRLLWVLGDEGLQCYDSEKNTFRSFTKKDGIPSYNFTGLEILDDNKLYITTSEQALSIDPNIILDNQFLNKPSPYFKSLSIDEIRFNKITNDESIEVKHDARKIEIEFNTNGFLSNETIKYEYRLIENDNDNKWQKETSQSNKVIYNQLPEGQYKFQLRAFNEGVKSDVIELNIKVNGIFYLQWWFYVLLSIITVVLVWFYFFRKSNRLKERQNLILDKQQKELENIFLKLESLRSQMNPHFIFNALNSIQDYILHNEKKLARTFLVKFSRLIRMYLEHSQQDEITLKEELNALKI